MRDWTMLVRERCLALLIAAILASPLAVTPLDAQERTFRPLRSLGGGSELTASVSLGDVNGDGALDVVVANGRHWPEQNRVYLNDGDAAFTLARRLGEEEAGSYAVPLADFDGDGDLDVAVGNDRTRSLIFFNDGNRPLRGRSHLRHAKFHAKPDAGRSGRRWAR